jgi:DNA-binding GntR family transcriptional regulator
MSLGTETASILRDAILDGRLAQGERVNEVQISRLLGISRGPLREALRRLEQDGLVTSEPHRGASIVRVTPHDVMDVLSIRKLLEPYAVAGALSRTDGVLVAALQAANREMLAAAAATDPTAVAAAHGRFHSAFYTHSGNQLLGRMWSRLEDPVRLYLQLRQSTFGDMSDIAGAHARLLKFATAGDVAAAQGEVLRHLDLNIKTISRLLRAAEQARAPAIREQAAGQ